MDALARLRENLNNRVTETTTMTLETIKQNIKTALPGLTEINRLYRAGERYDRLKKIAVVHGSIPSYTNANDYDGSVDGIIVEVNVVGHGHSHYSLSVTCLLPTMALRRHTMTPSEFVKDVSGHFKLEYRKVNVLTKAKMKAEFYRNRHNEEF